TLTGGPSTPMRRTLLSNFASPPLRGSVGAPGAKARRRGPVQAAVLGDNDAIVAPRLLDTQVAVPHIACHHRRIACEWIAEAAATRHLHQQAVTLRHDLEALGAQHRTGPQAEPPWRARTAAFPPAWR